MALRWKRNDELRGIPRVCAGPQGSILRIDNKVKVAAVYSHHHDGRKWYWVAGWDCPIVPYKNTCNEPPQSESEAKASATAYVRSFLMR